MSQVCTTCGAASTNNAAFCASCGRALKHKVAKKTPKSGSGQKWRVPVASIITLMVMGALYFWLFIADDLKRDTDLPVSEAQEKGSAEAQIFFAMTDANIRDNPATTGSNILGKLPRGSQVTGIIQRGTGPNAEWLALNDGNGFVALINLSQYKPPLLVKSLNDQPWVADGLVDIWATTLADSKLLDRVRTGTQITLVGITDDNFLEVKLAGGRFGYVADAQAILQRLGGKPISIGFNPQTCAFSGEIGTEFVKIGAQMRAQVLALEARVFVDEAVRDQAFAAIEGKSKFVRLRRSFEGLSLTGIAQHYESQSLYFDDDPAKVVDVFRAQGFDIGRDGLFTATEIYAGISPTRGEGAAFGKTELGCGV